MYISYRRNRGKSFAAATPERIVVRPCAMRRYPVDAAVLFSDIVVPLRAVGLDIDIKPGVGPVILDGPATSSDRPDGGHGLVPLDYRDAQRRFLTKQP